MRIVPRDTIKVLDRQRTKVEPGPLRELRDSILQKGLLHPPVCYKKETPKGDRYVLVAGGRRLQAIEAIHEGGEFFYCDGATITKDEVPITLVSDLSVADILEAELEENVIRVDLPWQDLCAARAAIHRQRQETNPGQTFLDTGRELAEKMGTTSSRGGKADALETRARSIAYQKIKPSVIVAEHLSDPTIAKARNESEAFQLVLKKKEEEWRAELAKRQIARGEHSSDITLKEGAMEDVLPSLPEGFVDLIIADPPYGIAASGSGFRSRTVHHHNYADDPDTARSVAQTILGEGFRVSKARANLFIFCDIRFWYELQKMAAANAWVPFPVPVIWRKSESEGLAPWGQEGFRRTYEAILFATKGQRGLITSPVDILDEKRVARHKRTFAAEKPVGLLRQLIECSTLPGEFVLDPCCGSGSTLVAARELGRRGLGIEKDPATYNIAMSNLYSKGEENGEGSDPLSPDLGGSEAGMANSFDSSIDDPDLQDEVGGMASDEDLSA